MIPDDVNRAMLDEEGMWIVNFQLERDSNPRYQKSISPIMANPDFNKLVEDFKEYMEIINDTLVASRKGFGWKPTANPGFDMWIDWGKKKIR